MSVKKVQPAEGHVFVPAVLIGSLAVLLAGGLAALGLLRRVDDAVASSFLAAANLSAPEDLPEAALWSGVVVVAYGLSFAILAVPGQGRRVLLWITTTGLVAFWAPVLALAAIEPRIAAPTIAAVWSGLCALAYAGRHRMPGE